MSPNSTKHFFSWLLHPATILFSLMLGILCGLFFPETAQHLKIAGDIFLNLLMVSVLPLVFTGISVSVARLLQNQQAKHIIFSLLICILSSLCFFSLLGIISGYLANFPLHISADTHQLVGQMMLASGNQKMLAGTSFSDFIRSMFSSNIFHSLAENKVIAVVIFSIMFGIATSSIPSTKCLVMLRLLDAVFETFLKFVNGICYLLPIGLFTLFSHQIALTGFKLIIAMGSLIFWIYLVSILSLTMGLWLIATLTKRSLWSVIKAMRQTIIVAFVTMSSFAALGFAIHTLEKDLGTDKQLTNLIMPIGVCIHPVGSVIMDALCVFFLMALYGKAITLSACGIIFIGAIFAAIAGGGVPSIAVLSLLAIMLDPLGLPLQTAITLFLAIINIIDPIATTLNVVTNSALTVLICSLSSNKLAQTDDPDLFMQTLC